MMEDNMRKTIIWQKQICIYIRIFLWPHLQHMEVPRLSQVRAVVTSLQHSHSNMGSETHLWPVMPVRLLRGSGDLCIFTSVADKLHVLGIAEVPHWRQDRGREWEKIKTWSLAQGLEGENLGDALFFFSFLFFAICWATPAAYGGSQARGRIGAVDTSLRQSHSKPDC